MAKENRFIKGSATFICDCCGHNTRFTNDQPYGTKICVACYDLAGYENMIQDGQFEESDAVQVVALFNEILKRSAAEHAKAIKSHDLAYNHPLVKAASIQAPIHYPKGPIEVSGKYVYPEGLTPTQKKAFRAQVRRSLKK